MGLSLFQKKKGTGIAPINKFNKIGMISNQTFILSDPDNQLKSYKVAKQKKYQNLAVSYKDIASFYRVSLELIQNPNSD